MRACMCVRENEREKERSTKIQRDNRCLGGGGGERMGRQIRDGERDGGERDGRERGEE